MNIGFDAKRAFNNATGLGNYSRTLIQGLAQFYPSHQYFLFTPSEKIPFLHKQPNISICKPQRFLHKKLSWYWRSFYLPQEERDAGLNIYHGLSNELPFGKPPTNVKQVVTIHDLIFLKHLEYYSLVDRNIYASKVRHSCKIADCIIAVSEQTKHDLVKWLPFAENKIKVVYQSCSSEFERKFTDGELRSIKQKFQLPPKYILYVGALSERKNLLNLVKAFHQIASMTDVNLVLAGDGNNYKTQIKKLVHSLELTNRVQIISGISNEELPAVYQMSSLFVYPSIYEGFGIPIIEALFSHVPVVTTQGGCLEEAGGPHSFYTDTTNPSELGNAMLEVLTNTTLRERMISEGLKHAQKFSVKSATENMMQVYESLL